MRIPFNIKYRDKIESGDYKVETKDGRQVRIVCWDVKNSYSKENDDILALVKSKGGSENALFYAQNGYCLSDSSRVGRKDLFIVTPESEMSEFEQEVSDIVDYCKEHGVNVLSDYAKRHAKALLAIAKQQLLQSGELLTQEHHEKLMETLREECKKDLPRWRIWRNGACGNSEGHAIALVHGAGEIRFVSCLGANGEKYIMLSDLEKLPGFNDEDHE